MMCSTSSSTLRFVALQVYEEPTVIIAQRVTGEEEVPEGAVAVLTPDAPDVLSHVSVRARNMKVLFAICHDPEELAKVRCSPCASVPLPLVLHTSGSHILALDCSGLAALDALHA